MEYLTEEQQVERLKRWWKEYGFAILGGVVLAIIIGSSWRYYQAYKTKIADQASLAYMMMISNDSQNHTAAAMKNAHLLKAQFSSTPYASLAAFYLAKEDVLANEYEAAQAELRWVIAREKRKDLRQVAKLRLARIDLQEGQAQAALQDLQPVILPAYQVMVTTLTKQAEALLKRTSDDSKKRNT